MSKTQDYFNKEYKDFNSSYTDKKNLKDIIRKLSYFYNKKAIKGRMDALLSQAGETIRQKNILEIGCGPGFYSIELAKRGANVTGLDYSTGMIETASKNAIASNVTVDFTEGNFLEYNFSKKFEIVFATGVIEYIDKSDQQQFMNKASEISGDVVIISFPKKYVLHAFIRQIWLVLFKGFSVSFFTNTDILNLAQKAHLKEISRVDVGILWVVKFKKV